jgi:SAM-dependent methyltransferase
VKQYETSDALKARRETHERYSERHDDLEAICADVLGLSGDESVLDVGCGYGLFLRHLRGSGHRGPVVGLDQSPAMVAEAGGGTVGDVQALPFAERAFDVVSARHMLYYPADIPAAVRELRRVAGVALVVTNAGEYMPAINRLILDAAPGIAHTGLRFHGDNAPAFLEAAFEQVELTVLRNALVFHETEPIVRYVWSTLFDKTDWAEVGPWVGLEAARRLEAMGGVWRDPKEVHIFRCR